MPLESCDVDGSPGWRWGSAGKCYVYEPDVEGSEAQARGRAMAQAYASGDVGEVERIAAARVARALPSEKTEPAVRVGPVIKVDDEMRFTLAPLYVPGVLDAHDEYADARELQESIHDYMRRGDLRLRLMHQDDRDPDTIGDVVEMFTLPWSIEVPMTSADGEKKSVKLPEGTVLTGVVWDERAWPAVKDGRIGGLSLGGMAVRGDGDPDVPTPTDLQGDFASLERTAGTVVHQPPLEEGDPLLDGFRELVRSYQGMAAASVQRAADRAPIIQPIVINVPEQPAPIVNVHPAEIRIEAPVQVNVPEQPAPIVPIEVNVPVQPAPIVNVAAPEVSVAAPPPAEVSVSVELERRKRKVTLERDKQGNLRGAVVQDG